ncbi:Fe-S cluster assembly protein SufD [Crateriforma conspicua]|uniref:FeS cluster assembly protein SufD n=1 Tax=Crateriforma conspicua TaxID=2527996 RepID=A0A5C5XSZ8_9PLAN|nr:Fe-S cluster assembly protein SufD [Crateriforma conspicua]TWT65453.1 FeS cluster assembly protein SufD [Crateriforma conspicua]
MIATEKETFQEQHVALQSQFSPAWLVELRQSGLDAFTRLGLPTKRLEDWRFTNVTALAKRSYELASLGHSKDATSSDVINAFVHEATLDEEFHRLVFINGCYCDQWSQTHDLPAGVTIDNLASVIDDRPDTVQSQLESNVHFDESAFAALNTAFINDGAVIDIPDGVVMDRPVHLVFLSIGNSQVVSHPRNLIRVGKHSKADVIETYLGQGDAYFTNAITQVSLEDSAKVDHHKLQHEQVGALHIALTSVDQRSNSNFRSHYFSTGASLARNELNCVLDGEEIETTLNGLYMPTGDQLMDCRTRIDHAKPHCNSHELYKGILDDKGKGVFNGKIFVHQGAQKTDAKQSNQALLLSDDAVVNTKPQLEIYADDVRCTHGATIGELDESAMYYLRSRGIPTERARKILIYAFANDVVQGVEIPAVRQHLESILLAERALTDV